MTLEERLDYWAEAKKPELNMLIVNDYEYVLLLTTFKSLSIPEMAKNFLSSDMEISAAWNIVHLPVMEWSNLTGIIPKNVRRLSNVLKRNNVILPDGRVNTGAYAFALSIGQNRVMNTVSNLRSKRDKMTPKQEAEENG